MPLSKKRMRVRERLDRMSNLIIPSVKPNSLRVVQPRFIYDNILVKPRSLPNCPDSRYREVDDDGNPIYNM